MKGKEPNKNSVLDDRPKEDRDEWDSVFDDTYEDDTSEDDSDHAKLRIKSLNLQSGTAPCTSLLTQLLQQNKNSHSGISSLEHADVKETRKEQRASATVTDCEEAMISVEAIILAKAIKRYKEASYPNVSAYWKRTRRSSINTKLDSFKVW